MGGDTHNLMEDKPLNFNQPFLSVRRHTPTATSVRTKKRQIYNSIPQLPSHRSELKSGPIRNPGAVPFLWEQSPGQPKGELHPQNPNSDKPPVAPKLPPGRHVVHSPRTNGNDSSLDQSVGRRKEEKECSESGDEAYVDALDTLSRAESSFLNCSMSGLSDLDNVKPSGNLSTDRQAREFMMDRFLPAAKAMASETTPQYVHKKQSFLQKQPEKKVNQHKPSLRYGPSFADRYSYSQDNKEDEESDDEYDQRQNVPAMCGFLPRFCLKSSLCLLSPVPAMSVRTRVLSSSAKKLEGRSSPAGSYNEFENKSRSDRAELKSIDKIQAAELDQEYTKSRNESGHVASLSTSTNASLPFLEDKEVLSVAEEKMDFKTFQELLDGRGSPEQSGSGDPVIEKTLYVDTVQKVESPLWSVSPKKPDANSVPSSRDEDHEIITKRIDQTHTVDSSLEDLKKLIAVDVDKKLPPNNQDFNVIEQESTESFEKQLSKEVTVDKCYQNHSGLLAPPPLPKSPSDSWLWRSVSTKSPSLRSYLDATTPNREKQLKTAPTSDHKKWETIVKASNVKHHHLHYSEEMLTTIPET
ncbi:hypothetical protein ACS0TY_017587 [Phlomoides rotata]